MHFKKMYMLHNVLVYSFNSLVPPQDGADLWSYHTRNKAFGCLRCSHFTEVISKINFCYLKTEIRSWNNFKQSECIKK